MDLNAIAQTFGFAAFCLVALAIGVAWSVRWTAKFVLLPLVTRHIAFIDFLEKRISEQAEMHSDNVKKLNEIHEQIVTGAARCRAEEMVGPVTRAILADQK